MGQTRRMPDLSTFTQGVTPRQTHFSIDFVDPDNLRFFFLVQNVDHQSVSEIVWAVDWDRFCLVCRPDFFIWKLYCYTNFTLCNYFPSSQRMEGNNGQSYQFLDDCSFGKFRKIPFPLYFNFIRFSFSFDSSTE